MKKSLLFYSLPGLIALAGLTGCEEKLEGPANPAKTGEEILFGASSRENPITRTVYDDVPVVDDNGPLYYRVTWEEDGSDEIAIFCPEAEGTTLCNYSVIPDKADATKSSTVTKVNDGETGLLWGEAGEHHFYGFYPASAVKGTENGKILCTIPVLQNPTGWKEVNNNETGGKTIYGTANTDYAYMWAYGCFNRLEQADYKVPLTFHPWVTILEIKIPGPKSGTMKVSSVNVEAIDGTRTVLSGDFICDMTPTMANPNDPPVYEAVNEGSSVRNTVTISCYREDKGDFVELGPNDILVVRAYLLPYQINTQTRTLQVRVSPLNRGVLTRTLKNPQNQEGGVLPHKVNTVIMPPLEDVGSNNWMSSLDPNIYLSELSIPGSWNSNINGGGSSDYQAVDIMGQFNSGIRGFMISTGALYTCEGFLGGKHFKDGDLYVARNGSRTNDRVESVLSQLADGLSNAKEEFEKNRPGEPFNEFAFVALTYDGGAVDFDLEIGGPATGIETEEAWIRTVQNDLQELKQNSSYLFTDAITPDTKISDVAGKIVVKVNTNSDDMDSYIAADAGLPSLFTRWYGAYLETGTPMRWGSPNHDNTANLTWFYQEVGNIYKNGPDYGASSTSGNASLNEKKQWISNVFTKSVELYKQGNDHSTWFFNCLGGTYADDDYNAQAFTNDITPWAVGQLQGRTENASLGLVFMNHADANSASANLIQTIIDNNFKFELRKAGN